MNRKLKMLTTTLLLSGSILAAVPVNAATTTEIPKSSGNITIQSISQNPPKDGYSGTLWCTGNGVYIRYASSGGVAGSMDRGDSKYFYEVSDGKAYFTQYVASMDATIVLYVDARYLSTIPA